jgi:hypothetical protein
LAKLVRFPEPDEQQGGFVVIGGLPTGIMKRPLIWQGFGVEFLGSEA